MRLKLLYSSLVCFPSNALSISVVYLPIPLGNSLFSLNFCSVTPRIVDLDPLFLHPTLPTPVACFAAFLALVLRVISSWEGT